MSEDNIADPLPSPAAGAVREFLDGPTAKQPVKLELPEHIQKELAQAAAPPEVQTRTDTPLDPAMSMDAPNTRNFLTWAMTASDVGQVEVTDTEKALFLKAALNDEEVRFDIVIPLGDSTDFKVRCRTLTTAEMDLLFNALRDDEQNNRIQDPARYISNMQAYALAMQIVGVNGKDTEPFRAANAYDIAGLRASVDALTSRTNHVRWHYLLTALRIFTIKIKLCTDAALNLDFWQTAGTD